MYIKYKTDIFSFLCNTTSRGSTLILTESPPIGGHICVLPFDVFHRSCKCSFVCAFEVFQMCSAVSNHLDETTTRMVIFLVFFQMSREFINTRREKRDLQRRRPRVSCMDLVLFDK